MLNNEIGKKKSQKKTYQSKKKKLTSNMKEEKKWRVKLKNKINSKIILHKKNKNQNNRNQI
jgi:hypothetical protein